MAYNKICQQTPTAPDCGLPLYWPAPAAGAEDHRRHAPLHLGHALRSASRRAAAADAAAAAATARSRIAPTPASIRPGSPPALTRVRLTANGKSLTQPIVVKMDPRVKITPEVQQIFTLTTQMEDNARNAARLTKMLARWPTR